MYVFYMYLYIHMPRLKSQFQNHLLYALKIWGMYIEIDVHVHEYIYPIYTHQTARRRQCTQMYGVAAVYASNLRTERAEAGLGDPYLSL